MSTQLKRESVCKLQEVCLEALGQIGMVPSWHAKELPEPIRQCDTCLNKSFSLQFTTLVVQQTYVLYFHMKNLTILGC